MYHLLHDVQHLIEDDVFSLAIFVGLFVAYLFFIANARRNAANFTLSVLSDVFDILL